MHSITLHLPLAKISQMHFIKLHLPPPKISQMHSIMLHLPPGQNFTYAFHHVTPTLPQPKFQMYSIMLHIPPSQNFTDAFHHVTPTPHPKFHRCIPSCYTYPLAKISQMYSIMLHLPPLQPKFHRCIPSHYTNIPTLHVMRHTADKHSCYICLSVIPFMGGGGCPVDTPLGRHALPADGYCSGRYASYWNAFLLRSQFLNSSILIYYVYAKNVAVYC